MNSKTVKATRRNSVLINEKEKERKCSKKESNIFVLGKTSTPQKTRNNQRLKSGMGFEVVGNKYHTDQ